MHFTYQHCSVWAFTPFQVEYRDSPTFTWEISAMARVAPYHSILKTDRQVYHDRSAGEGRNGLLLATCPMNSDPARL